MKKLLVATFDQIVAAGIGIGTEFILMATGPDAISINAAFTNKQ